MVSPQTYILYKHIYVYILHIHTVIRVAICIQKVLFILLLLLHNQVIYLMSRVWNQLSGEEKNRDMSALTKDEKNQFVEIGKLLLASGDHKYS